MGHHAEPDQHPEQQQQVLHDPAAPGGFGKQVSGVTERYFPSSNM